MACTARIKCSRVNVPNSVPGLLTREECGQKHARHPNLQSGRKYSGMGSQPASARHVHVSCLDNMWLQPCSACMAGVPQRCLCQIMHGLILQSLNCCSAPSALHLELLQRATGATKMNEVSSRSHAVCIIIVEKCTTILNASNNTDASSAAAAAAMACDNMGLLMAGGGPSSRKAVAAAAALSGKLQHTIKASGVLTVLSQQWLCLHNQSISCTVGVHLWLERVTQDAPSQGCTACYAIHIESTHWSGLGGVAHDTGRQFCCINSLHSVQSQTQHPSNHTQPTDQSSVVAFRLAS